MIDPEIRRVVRLGAISYGGAPAWSPDGGQLAFRGPDGRIRVHDRASGSTTRVPGAGGSVGPGDLACSPDGDRLLTFTSADAKGYGLVSVLLDGSTTERRSPWTWALDWIAVDDVDWSSR